jgi:prevent-host-death family protein
VTVSSETLRTVLDRFSSFNERVHTHHERVVVTKNGTPAAALFSPEDLESREETVAVPWREQHCVTFVLRYWVNPTSETPHDRAYFL